MCALAILTCGIVGVFSGCEKQTSDTLQIVCTTFPQYDWVKNIVGDDDGVTVKILQTSGADLHNYQPTASDLRAIYQSDVFVYVGGESDDWVTETLASSSANPDTKKVDLLEALGDRAVRDEDVPGSEEEEGDDHPHDHEHYDEHVWLSLKNAKVLCAAICTTLSETNPESKDLYESNLASYTVRLDALDAEYQTMTENAARNTLLFADRFPFRYLAVDYNLNYYAAFSGCSAETEASFATITNLAGIVDELSLPYILILEGSDGNIAASVIAASKTKPEQLTVNSLQSVTKKDIENGTTYLGLMTENLSVLETALN